MTFRPNCIAPGKESNLVLSSNIRGTFDILWSLLFTLLTCTWTVQHLNIPTQASQSRYKFISWVLDIWYKLKWMLLTLVLPEFLIGKALQDFSRARASISYLDDKNLYTWTTTHGFYADMGGYVLKARQRRNNGETVPAPIYLNCRPLYFACTGDARAESLIETIPNITKREIEDKSKGDLFVKATAVVQVSWMIVQTIVRGARGLAVSQLEIAVLAYSACTIITYILYLKKSQNVKVPTVILLKRKFGGKKLTTQHQEAIRDCHPRSWFTMSLRLFRYKGLIKDYRNVLDPIPNDARYDDVKSLLFTEKSLLTRMDDGFVIAGLVFGSLPLRSLELRLPHSYRAIALENVQRYYSRRPASILHCPSLRHPCHMAQVSTSAIVDYRDLACSSVSVSKIVPHG
ncbi:uncharacterized protein PAC_14446 [Phialocephala subalpina]|uniref:Uncharacterized protein n=1 Tax=Phialocephala subalpina TaxID=576137 RepID=A0A1L7XHR2_9HELO|nr:uncharacterized protein PAC_14446 [Phialocephala subalpina]